MRVIHSAVLGVIFCVVAASLSGAVVLSPQREAAEGETRTLFEAFLRSLPLEAENEWVTIGQVETLDPTTLVYHDLRIAARDEDGELELLRAKRIQITLMRQPRGIDDVVLEAVTVDALVLDAHATRQAAALREEQQAEGWRGAVNLMALAPRRLIVRDGVVRTVDANGNPFEAQFELQATLDEARSGQIVLKADGPKSSISMEAELTERGVLIGKLQFTNADLGVLRPFVLPQEEEEER